MVKIESHLINLAMAPMPITGRIPMDLNFIISHNSRAAAQAAGVDRYFTGGTCAHGHMSDRYTSTGNCIECHEQRAAIARREVKIDPDETPIPPCLKGKPTLAPCLKCSRFPNQCDGKNVSTQLMRATQAFPDHGHVSARAAREAGVSVYRPNEPCEACGRVSWRSLGGKCGECDQDERKPWRKWTDVEREANRRQVEANINDPERVRQSDQINKD